MKRRVFIMLAASILSACSFGANITADEALSRVYETTAKDAQQTTHQTIADVRARHQTELETEIYRLCGTLEDGSTPPKCKLPEVAQGDDTRESAEILHDAAATIEAEIHNAPKESMIILARQYAELATVGLKSEELPKETQIQTPHDIERLRAAIDHEYGNAYALEVASAKENGGTEAQLDEAAEKHRKTAQQLSKYLSEKAPAPAPGYVIEDPVDNPNAFSAKLEQESVSFWLSEAVAAETPEWRTLCLRASAQAALQALIFDPNTEYLHTTTS
ncbi:DUF4439 domain-containing protein [Corynebacterium freiburgense]|uniref:DUF4439 domain-containing protein n=1 Tax=Corynebacterium freiburgense TaxID=556548 RepID=UPI0003F912CA|nr:DUF4439 domain-containing protein [Corynebacterium freiburgense]WJZ02966.1 hypothetical protein CFREI_08440 [Corynebacterium freiburgense]